MWVELIQLAGATFVGYIAGLLHSTSVARRFFNMALEERKEAARLRASAESICNISRTLLGIPND